MATKTKEHGKIEKSQPPLEDPNKDWAEEDVELENRKPDLAEIEEDEAGL